MISIAFKQSSLQYVNIIKSIRPYNRFFIHLKNKPKINHKIKALYGFAGATAIIGYNQNFIVKCEAIVGKGNNELPRTGAEVVKGQNSRVEEIERVHVVKSEPEFDWKEFCKILLPHWKHLVIAVGSALAVAAINIQLPLLLGGFVDIITNMKTENISEQFKMLMRGPVYKIASYYALQAGFTFSYIYSLGCVGERVAQDLRKRLFKSIMNQDISFFDTHMTGEIVNRLTSDVQEFKSSFKICISQGLRNICQTIGCFVSLYLISPEMTKMTLLSIPPVILIGATYGSLLRKLSRRSQAQLSKATGVGEEAISNIRTVRAFSMEHKECEVYSKELEKATLLNEQLAIGIGIFQGGSNLFLNGIVLGVICMGGKLISSREMTSGALLSFLVSAQTIQRSLTNLSLLFGHYIRGIGAGARVFEYIKINPTIGHDKGLIIDQLRGEIEFKDVHFTYPSRQDQEILSGLNLRIPAGKVVGVVGPSGGGKSTLVCLLERFYDIEKGSLTIDGVSMKDLDNSWLRGTAIGLINQEPVLFASSVMENIRYGKPSASDAEVVEAAKKANALNFINEFPNKFETVLGERGVTLSGGQKQRIAIARALIKEPKILILDEATSALDTASEKIVQETLDKLMEGRTVLVIAHRLSTIQKADIIAVVQNGKIVELGSHSELCMKKGVYHHLVQQQEILN